jgi:outer membrane protein assembly factor BamB
MATLPLVTQMGGHSFNNSGTDNSGDWPSRGYNARNTRYNSLSTAPKIGFSNVWKIEVKAKYNSSPIVLNNSIYYRARGGRLACINIHSGKNRWTLKVDGEITTPPIASGQSIYIGTSKGSILSVNIRDSSIRWKTSLESISDSGVEISTSPILVNNNIFAITEDGIVLAVDKKDGTIRWQTDPKYPSSYSPAADDGKLYVISPNALFSLDQRNGEEVWKYDTDRKFTFQSGPTIGNSLVYVSSSQDGLYAIDAQTGEFRWLADDLNTADVVTPPAVMDEIVYVGFDRVYAINSENGSIEWKSKSLDAGGVPTIADDTVFISSHTLNKSGIYAINIKNGQIRWIYDINSIVPSGPIIANGTLIAITRDDRMFALKPGKTKRSHWIDILQQSIPEAVLYESAGVSLGFAGLISGAYLWRHVASEDDTESNNINYNDE